MTKLDSRGLPAHLAYRGHGLFTLATSGSSSDAELDALTRSLREFGFVQPVLARKHDKMVIGGHQRLLAARRLGWKTVPVAGRPERLMLIRLLRAAHALQEGQAPWNKDRKGIHPPTASELKPGPRPQSGDAIGTVRLRMDKQGDPRAWVKRVRKPASASPAPLAAGQLAERGRYWSASARWAVAIASASARSAMVRLTLRRR